MEIMMRKTIFDILSQDFDIDHEVENLWRLFSNCRITEKPSYDDEWLIGIGLPPHKRANSFSILDFVNKYAFANWKSRGTYISCEDLKSKLEIDKILTSNLYREQNSLLILLEFIFNMLYRCDFWINKNKVYYVANKDYEMLINNAKQLLTRFGFTLCIYQEEEKIIIIEENTVATAVAEISKPETAKKIIQYNHYSQNGDLEKKKEILLKFAHEMEPQIPKLKQINSNIESDLFLLFNKLNIRHNNTTGKKKNNLFPMPNGKLEYWYDETYQLYLLAKLLLDNIERTKKIKELNVKGNTGDCHQI
jgi:hypothetical protein